MKRKIAILLIIALILSFIPAIIVNAAETTVVYQKISSMDELTTGKYVMVDSGGYAPTTLGTGTSPWVQCAKPTVSGDTITEANASGYIWDLTVNGTSVTLKDSAGKFIKPKSGNNNGIQNGTYNWAVSCTSGAFQFKGTGSDTTTLARNGTSGYRSYKNTTAANYPNSFTLYKMTEVSSTDPTEAPTEEPTEAPTDPPVPTYDGTFYKLTAENQLTTGKYVMVLKDSYAMSVLDSNWVLSEAFTPAGDSIANPAQALVWDVTVTDGTVTLKDSNGEFIKPNSTSSASIGKGEHNWTVAYTDGTFQFVGSGDYNAFTLAANSGSSYKLRAYKSSTVSGNPTGYPSFFTLYRLVENGTELPTTPPTEPTEAPTTAPTEAPTTAPTEAPTVAPDVPVADEATIVFDDAGKREIASETQHIWRENNITVTQDKGTGSALVENVAPIRVYKNAKLTIAYPKAMTKMEITCNTTDYASALQQTIGGSTVDGKVVTVILATPATSFPIEMTVGQVRVDSIKVYTTAVEVPTEPTQVPTEAPTTAPTQAPTQGSSDIVYVYGDAGKYTDVIINWGTRDEVATQLSPNAIAFYNANNTSYIILSALNGSSTVSSVPDSELYKALQELMVSNFETQTSYDDLKDLLPLTDTQKSNISNLTCLYTGESVSPTWDSAATWNREHVWPKSKNNHGETALGNADVMALRATNASINSSRGSKAYGLTTDTNYFYPNDRLTGHDIRGDVARSILYSYVRWDYANTATTFGASGVIESVEVMLTWMEEDPVDTWEMGRNDSVESITGTRNVFIDFPELAFLLFGETVPASMQTPSGNTPDVPVDPNPTTPTTPATEPVVGGDYQKITSMDQLTTGKYVLVVAGTSKGDVAMGTLNSTWVTSGLPTITGDTITKENAEGYILTLTVTNGTVTIKDANGKFISSSNSENKMAEGETSWRVDFADGTFRFVHTGGADERYLSLNKSSDSGFRPYKSGTATANSGGYPSYFTLYKLTEGGATEPDVIKTGASYNVHLIEPWALRVNVQFAKNTQDNLIPVADFTSYGAYAIIGNKFEGATAEELMADPDAVKYSNELDNVTAGDTSFYFDFYDGLYSYNLGESIYWVAYFVTADGTHYTEVIEKSLTDVADSLLGKDDVSKAEKDVLQSMKDLKDAVIALRGENADLGNVYAPGTANTNGLGDRNTGYQFGTSNQIKLIEPWGVRVRVLMREKTAESGVYADYENADDYGVIFFHDKTGKYNGTMTAAQMSAETGAKVYSKLAGNATINANGVTAVYDEGIYTYDLDTELYCLPYIVVDGEYYYPANATCWNLLGEMGEFAEDTSLDPKEIAVFEAILEMYNNVKAKNG